MKFKKIRTVASLLPFVILLCAIEMGGCSNNCTNDTAAKAIAAINATADEAKKAATEAENAATEAEDAVPDDCVDCNTLKQRVLKLDNDLDVDGSNAGRS